MKRVEDVFLDGAGALFKNKKIFIVPVLDSITQIIIVFIWAMLGFFLALISLVGHSGSGIPAKLVFALALSMSGYVICSMSASAFYTSAVANGCLCALKSQDVTFRGMFESAKKRWVDVLLNMLSVVILGACSIFLFFPAVLAGIYGAFGPAMGLGGVAASLAVVFLALFYTAMMPLYYLVALCGGKPAESMISSYRFVRENLVAVLLISFTHAIVQSLVFAPATLITGPLQTLDIFFAPAGSMLSLMISMPVLWIISVVFYCLGAIWWTGLIADRKGLEAPCFVKEFETNEEHRDDEISI